MSLTEQVDNFLLKEAQKKNEERGVADNYTFYPSSAKQCIRKIYFERKNGVIFPPSVYKYFVIGNLLHDWLQKNIFPNAKNEESIQWTEGKLKFRGRIDCLTPEEIIEFKSISDLKYVTKNPKPEHVAQLNMYLHAKQMLKGRIVYVTKNDLSIIEHEVVYSPKLYKSTINDFRKVSKCLVNGVEPKNVKCPTPWCCNYCRGEVSNGGVKNLKVYKRKSNKVSDGKVLG